MGAPATPVARPTPAAPSDRTAVIPPPASPHLAGTSPSGLALGTPQPTASSSQPGSSPGSSSPFRTEVSGVHVQPAPGVKFNQYELIRELGQGGMGVVYLARDTKLGRRVAVKFLQTPQPELSQRFLLEARATARCSHENIVIIYEVGEYVQTPFMALEFLQGQPLQKLIEGGQKLPVGRVVELSIPVLRALVCAHEQGIAHRDLKPDNVFVTDTGTVKVLDFGIAKVLQEKASNTPSAAAIRLPTAAEMAGQGGNHNTETGLTRSGAIMGTMAYMSPEQWGIGGIEIDHRTDIWAMGIMMWRMLTGRHPLHPLRGQQLVITAMLDQPMPSIREAMQDLPAGLAAVIDRCLKKNKDERYPTAMDLLRALEPYGPGRFTREIHVDQSPYAGLASFQENDAARFFGRSREIAAMVNRIRTQPMLAVVGSSGVGKSSLVRAGLVPALKRSGEAWECQVLRPGRNPMAALVSMMSPMMATSNTIADEVERNAKTAQRLKDEPGYLGATMRAQAVRENKRILIFVDQFEELYTNVADDEERQAFVRCLAAAADDATAPVRLVLSVRSDFLDRVAENPQFMAELNQGLFFVLPPNRDGLRDALVQPAEMAGYHFEDVGMVEDMLDHLAQTPGALPLLQFTAAKLWDARDSARKMFTKASYQAIGGIGGALASHADAVLNKMTPTSQGLVRALFLRLVTPERTRAIISMKELDELAKDNAEVKRVVDQLAYARLVVVQTAEGGGTSTVEIVHESLIHSWPTLKKWLDEGHEDSVFMEQLRQAARQWQQKGHDAGLLWRGEIVGEARKFRARYRGELPWVQESFLRAVFDAHDKGVRRNRLLVVGGFIFLGALVAAAMVALFVINQQRGKAQSAAAEATQAEKVARSAKQKAEDALAETIRKEEERRAAEDAQRLAERDAAKANAKVAQSAEELQRANAELLLALEDTETEKEKAKKERDKAEKAEKQAVEAAAAARKAEAEAVMAKAEVEKLLAKERLRVKELTKQIGDIVEELK
ncbi:MAG: protein kinase [Kofleriaceae bacterium]|nr:protein kinase [Myxococcales bacterium]MCB9564711.1 protein kinase [Kofleriaceae bacterium]MCB9573946.1 protein kinase [Kofleriaceae bacterium]